MAQIIGKVYGINFETKKIDGKEKKTLRFDLGSRRAMKSDDPKETKIFTKCVAYGSTADFLSEHLREEEWVALYGNFHEYKWMPDVEKNEKHERYYETVTLTKEQLEGAGFKIASGPDEVSLQFPVEQTTRNFVVNGFEFVGDKPEGEKKKPKSSSKGSGIIIGGVKKKVTDDEVPAGDVPEDGSNDHPF